MRASTTGGAAAGAGTVVWRVITSAIVAAASTPHPAIQSFVELRDVITRSLAAEPNVVDIDRVVGALTAIVCAPATLIRASSASHAVLSSDID